MAWGTRVTRATFEPLVLGRTNISGIGSGLEPVMHETIINNYYGDAELNQLDEQYP